MECRSSDIWLPQKVRIDIAYLFYGGRLFYTTLKWTFFKETVQLSLMETRKYIPIQFIDNY